MEEKHFEGPLPRTEKEWAPFLVETSDITDSERVVGRFRRYSIFQRAYMYISDRLKGEDIVEIELGLSWEKACARVEGPSVDKEIDRAVRMVEAGLTEGSRYFKDAAR
jgi:hypothetical protein